MKSENQRLQEFLEQNGVSQDDFSYVKDIIPIWLNDVEYNFNNYVQNGLKPVTDNEILELEESLSDILDQVRTEKEDRGL